MEEVAEIKNARASDKLNEYELSVLEKNSLKIFEKIRNFCDGKPVALTKHLSVFYETLIRSNNDIFQAAQKAMEQVDECCLCVGCTQCAKEFYKTILLESKKDRPLPGELLDYFGNNSQFYYYLSAFRSVKEYRKIKNTLICLKGFSSTTPAIYSATFENACTGGGLYLNVEGYGIVIDPGIGFVDSMHKQGIFIEDINAVVVTHNHLDHNADVGTLSALLHDLNGYYKRQVEFYSNFFHEVKHKEHKIEWIFDKSTKESTKSIISESKELIKYESWKRLNDHVLMSTIETQHIKDGISYGLKFIICLESNELKIGYTSDTKFFPELVNFFSDVDILIFNISDIYEKDVRGIKRKGTHLGYDGSINLLTENCVHPKLAIASEFCCSNGDYRMKVTRKLMEQVGQRKNMHIVPGEVGLKVDLNDGGICCSKCKRVVPSTSISVVAPEQEFGKIQYVCNNCQYALLNSG